MNSRAISTFLILFFYCNPLLKAQDKILNVWEEKIPNVIENNSVKEEIVLTETGAERTRNVTKPTLSVYFPPKEIANGTAVVICPGGGYGRLAIPHEGTAVAEWFNKFGITAFVLKYRLPNDLIMKNKNISPLQDVQEAIRIVRRNAEQWNINPNKIGVMGFSAGGHLAATASTLYNDNVYEHDGTSARPDFSILIYPVISMTEKITHAGSRQNLLGESPNEKLVEHFSNELQVNESTPPAFLIHSADDKSVPVQNSVNYFLSLKKFHIPAELHIYEKGGHGYGLAEKGESESHWPEACINWLEMHEFISLTN